MDDFKFTYRVVVSVNLLLELKIRLKLIFFSVWEIEVFKYQNVLILYCEYQNFSDALKHCCILEEIVFIIEVCLTLSLAF